MTRGTDHVLRTHPPRLAASRPRSGSDHHTERGRPVSSPRVCGWTTAPHCASPTCSTGRLGPASASSRTSSFATVSPHAPARGAGEQSRRSRRVIVQLALLQLRPQKTRRGTLVTTSGQSPRDSTINRASSTGGHCHRRCPIDGDELLQSERRQPVASRHRRARRMVIVETSQGLPYVHGEQTGLHISEVDYVIEGTTPRRRNCRNRLSGRSTSPPGGSSHLKSRTATACRSGSVACPTRCARCCSRRRARSWRAHGDDDRRHRRPVSRPDDLGARKQLNPGAGLHVALGSRDLYTTLNRNPDMHCCPVD